MASPSSHLIPALAALLAACTHAPSPSAADAATSSLARDTAPVVRDADRAALVAGNNAFALDLYRSLRSASPNANLFFSPYSASIALAMTYAGTRGATADEMARALHFTLPPHQLHSAFDAIDLQLASPPGGPAARELRFANSIWADRSMPLEPTFLDTLAVDYGAGVRLVDFTSNAAGARDAINASVREETHGKIRELVTPSSVDDLTRLVLTNAVYFVAGWTAPFYGAHDAPFVTADGRTVTVPLMSADPHLQYAEGEGWQAIRVPYGSGETSMLVLLPTAGALDVFESTLDVDRVTAIVGAMQATHTLVVLPKLSLEPEPMDLAPHLRGLGMVSAFEPARADLSGMTGSKALFVSAFVQKTFLRVDENGTEAAAATAAGTSLLAAPDKTFQADHPFLFAIRDEATGTLLFVGRVVDPSP